MIFINRRSKSIPAVMVMVMMAVLVGLGGCANQSKPKPSPYEKWRIMAEKNKGYSPTARHRKVELEAKKIETYGEEQTPSKPTKPLPTRRISMKMNLTDVPVLLRALARSVNLNIMINENVTGKISVNVQNARWDQVFSGILNSQGLDYEWEGEIIRIVTQEDRDRSLKSLEAEEKILAKKLEMRNRAPMITKIIPIDFASAEKIRVNIEKVLGQNSDGAASGTVLVDTHTNSLIIQAKPADIAQIIPMIVELDRPTPQILIEAFIIETNSRTARELGVQWTGLYQFDTGDALYMTPNTISAAEGINISTDVDPTAGTAINFPANLDNATQEGTGFLLGLLTQGTDGLLGIQLSALEEAGELNILSSPSITTLDNAKATIESGDQVPIPVIEEGASNVIYKEALLSLEVTPHVIQDDVLKLEIVTTKNEVDFSRTVLTYPTIISKKASTNVILFNGQTTVIGGLKKNTNRDNQAGVPWLMRIPGLGYLFKNEGKSDEMQELLIFITPRILAAFPEGASPVSENSP
jgi:type IV pilus assembly protein PilQ